MSKLTTIQKIKLFAEDKVTTGEYDLAKFKKHLEENPAYAFEWSYEAFKAAARIHVGKSLLYWTEKDEATAEKIIDFVKDMVLRGARYPERSTSVQSNEMKREIISVYAELLDVASR